MRVLFVATPLIGHLFPMMPLARHLHASGHTVLVATGGDAVTARDSGVAVENVWPPFGLTRAVVRALALHPRAALNAASGMADAAGAGRVFAATNKPMLEPLTRLADRFEPDIIVHEPFAAAAAVAGVRLGVPSVLHNVAFDNGEHITAEILLRLGHPHAGPRGATISIAPPSIVSVPGWPMQYVPYAIGDTPPAWLRQTPERPRILVTRSTMLGDGPDAMLSSTVAAARDIDAEFVIVRPNHRIQHSALPGNVRTVGWTALDSVLPACAAMINHGGAGSVYAALRAGVPQIATPAPGDRRWNAELVQRRGAGLSLRPRQITARRITELLTTPRYRTAATQVATEIADMPTLEQISAKITALITRAS
ncbi:glycosyltransferase [Nocardia sp. NPDC051570]|uniref:glycosyltransferase n=1 Tax=Nocardia sp. NPDC051570 TaxID=3364324 RepID=UPI003793B4FD